MADLFIGVYLTHNPLLDKENCLVHSLSVLKYAFFGLEEVAADEKSITEAFFLQESSWEAIEEDFKSWQGQYSTYNQSRATFGPFPKAHYFARASSSRIKVQ